MTLLTTLRNFLGIRPKLRNKPGGLAWIQHHGQGTGAESITGQIVRTVRTDSEGFWDVDPHPEYIATCNVIFDGGKRAYRGERVVVGAIHDSVLIPIPDAKLSKDEVEELYLTGPVRAKETV